MSKKTKQFATMSRRRFLGTGSVAIATGMMAGGLFTGRAFALEDAVLEAARQEGRVTFYSVVPQEIAQPFIEGFQAMYGITLDYQRLTSGPLGQRYAAEAEAGTVVADALAMTDVFFMRDAAERGWLAPVAELPDAEAFPDQFKQDNFVSVQLLPHGFAYNSSIVPEAPTSWEALLDPAYRGRLVLVDPRNGFYTSVWYYALMQAFGIEYLQGLAAQSPILIQSASQGVQQVAAGAAAICAPAYPNMLPALQDAGAPIDLALPEPTVASAVFAAVSANAPHPNAARVLMAYLLSEEGQALYNASNVSPLGELEGTLPLPPITDIDLAAVQEAQPTIFAALGVQ